jgi:S1-C subfamily serine protease
MTVDTLMPSAATRLVDRVTEALDREGFPRVFEGLGPEPIRPVPAPDPAALQSPAIRTALGSVIHVRADAPSCDQVQVGSGWVAEPGLVVTNARDVAVLAVDGLGAPALVAGGTLGAGDDAVVAGFPGDEGLYVGAARVREVIVATGADIYGRPGVDRQVYSLRADIRKGASGGPVLDANGRAVGMVFASSLDDSKTGYALTLAEVAPVLEQAEAARTPASTQLCTAS